MFTIVLDEGSSVLFDSTLYFRLAIAKNICLDLESEVAAPPVGVDYISRLDGYGETCAPVRGSSAGRVNRPGEWKEIQKVLL